MSGGLPVSPEYVERIRVAIQGYEAALKARAEAESRWKELELLIADKEKAIRAAKLEILGALGAAAVADKASDVALHEVRRAIWEAGEDVSARVAIDSRNVPAWDVVPMSDETCHRAMYRAMYRDAVLARLDRP